jgi:hypothetical protein
MTAVWTDNKRSHLPIIDRPLDNTAMSAYMTCPREYYFGMVLHRRGKGKSPALVFGSAWHKAMEMHYKSGGDYDLVKYAVATSWEGHGDQDDYRTQQRVILDYERYRKHYGEDPNKEESGKTVGTVGELLVELSTNAQGEDLVHPWAGKLDRIIEIDGLYYIEDHKTTSRLDKHFFRQFELSNQMMGYTYLAKALLPSLTVVGVRINVSHVLTEKTAFHRQLVTFGPQQIKRWTEQTNIWMGKLSEDYELLADERAKNPDIVIPDAAFPQHFGDNGCSRKFGMCGYWPICSSSPKLQPGVLEREYEIRPWNPLEAEHSDG